MAFSRTGVSLTDPASLHQTGERNEDGCNSHSAADHTSIPRSIDTNNGMKPVTFDCISLVAPHDGHIQIILLNLPRTHNAISVRMLHELHTYLNELSNQTTTSTRALIIASSTPGTFCSGINLHERQQMTPADTSTFLAKLRDTFSTLAGLRFPTIACVSGPALGGGAEIVLACTLRVFSARATLGFPETKLGVVPGAGGTWRLVDVVGLARAADLVLTGRRIGAMEAERMGLVSRLVGKSVDITCQEEEWKSAMDESVRLARDIAKGAPIAIEAALRAVVSRNGEAAEEAAYEMVLGTRDRVEGLSAFNEKRTPVYIGK